tara:strand:+ start:183 stop:308 length:126 start_codon:yes stop_codon:yes gene_type:complete
MKGFFNAEAFTSAFGVGGEELKKIEFATKKRLFISKINSKS